MSLDKSLTLRKQTNKKVLFTLISGIRRKFIFKNRALDIHWKIGFKVHGHKLIQKMQKKNVCKQTFFFTYSSLRVSPTYHRPGLNCYKML